MSAYDERDQAPYDQRYWKNSAQYKLACAYAVHTKDALIEAQAKHIRKIKDQAMSMSKKDYEAIARAIRQTTKDYCLHTPGSIDPEAMMADLTWSIADHCQQESDTFDRARFLKACGVSE